MRCGIIEFHRIAATLSPRGISINFGKGDGVTTCQIEGDRRRTAECDGIRFDAGIGDRTGCRGDGSRLRGRIVQTEHDRTAHIDVQIVVASAAVKMQSTRGNKVTTGQIQRQRIVSTTTVDRERARNTCRWHFNSVRIDLNATDPGIQGVTGIAELHICATIDQCDRQGIIGRTETVTECEIATAHGH